MPVKYFVLNFLAHGLNLLPNRVVLFLGDIVGTVWYFLIPLRRKTVIENMTLALGDSMTAAQTEKLALKCFRHLGRVILESWRAMVWTADDFRKNVILEGLEHLEPFLKAKRGGFLISAHTGCWELSPGTGVAHGVDVDVIAKYGQRKGAEPFLKSIRTRLGVNVIPVTRSTPQILESVRAGRWIGFMLDQFMGPPPGIPVTFFGQIAGTTASAVSLSEKYDIPCVLAYTYRDTKGIIHTVLEAIEYPPLSEDLTRRVWEKTQYFNDLLESKIRQHPEQWTWVHRRWKPFLGTPKWDLPHLDGAAGYTVRS